MIYFSQSKIDSWQTCERQFQLRYISKNGWPESPHQADSVDAMALGELFHSLVAQKILIGEKFTLPDFSSDPVIKSWWANFESFGPKLKAEDHFRIESKLTATLNDQVKLTGRIDLLVHNDRALKIYDWKTGRPRSKSELQQDWQTRIYMALLYTSRSTICGKIVSPKNISMTYWYARDPQQSVTLCFDEDWHEENLQEIVELGNQVLNRLSGELNIWPLTTNLDSCGRCSFNTLCGREPVSGEESALANHLEEIDPDILENSLHLELDIHPDL